MSIDDPLRRLISLFDEKDYLLDIFYLLNLDEIDVPTSQSTAMPFLLVPVSFDLLFLSTDYDLLGELFRWARPSRQDRRSDIEERLAMIRRRYAELRKLDLIRVIDDEADEELSSAVQAAIEAQHKPLSGRALETLHRGLTTILTVSKREAKALMMRGRDLVRLLRGYVSELELPSKLTAFREKKQAFSARLIPLIKTGGNVEYLISIVALLSTLAFPAVLPVAKAVEGAGALLLFIDP
jgi:hypothetical protein